jgi:gamma-glutamyltranspeptidase/glutathione hydrolase
VDGFLLNNQLTDFSLIPSVDGKKVVNRVEPNKRPKFEHVFFVLFESLFLG